MAYVAPLSEEQLTVDILGSAVEWAKTVMRNLEVVSVTHVKSVNLYGTLHAHCDVLVRRTKGKQITKGSFMVGRGFNHNGRGGVEGRIGHADAYPKSDSPDGVVFRVMLSDYAQNSIRNEILWAVCEETRAGQRAGRPMSKFRAKY